MKKTKYVYDKNTLRYEKVKSKKNQLLFQLLLVVFILSLITTVIYLINQERADHFRQQRQELLEMQKQYNEMQEHLVLMQKTLENLSVRDSAIYRQLLELNPEEGFSERANTEERIKKLSDQALVGEISEKMYQMRQKLIKLRQIQTEVLASIQDREKMLRDIPSIRPIRYDSKKQEYISGFGYRKHPVFKILKVHGGIDFGAELGTAVYATGNGKVQKTEYRKDGYGKYLTIDHGYQFLTLYAQLSEILVKPGQTVKKGQIIARVGDSGGVAPHLHYELLYKKKRINPLPFCRDGISALDFARFTDAATKQNQALSIHP